MVMSNRAEGKSDTAEEIEFKMEEREQTRREEERGEWEDLNQSLQTGTHDAVHQGIKWGPSYRTRRKQAKRNQGSKNK
jgi:hypothetical protein